MKQKSISLLITNDQLSVSKALLLEAYEKFIKTGMKSYDAYDAAISHFELLGYKTPCASFESFKVNILYTKKNSTRV